MSLTIRRTQFTDNTAGDGGAIYVEDTGGLFTIEDSTISGNQTGDDGGGVYFYDPDHPVLISRTTISGNTAGDRGGGVYLYNMDAGAFTIENSTISGNNAAHGGGVFVDLISNDVVIRNTTIASNTATTAGGGFMTNGNGFNSGLDVINTILANNTATGNPNDLQKGISTLGAFTNSLIEASPLIVAGVLTGVGSSTNNILEQDPDLGALANNGGLTRTHQLLAGSPALDAGLTTAVTTDQRGVTRDNPPDIGAFEAVNLAPTAVAATPNPALLNENTSTATRIKVADITITDDIYGANALSLSGADAGDFEIDGLELFLKAGTVLDFETKSSYSVRVNADDTTVGGTADAFQDFALSLNNVNENPVVSGFDSAVTYVEDNPALVLDLDAAVSDVDAGNLEAGTLTIALTANADSADRLTIRNQGVGPGQIGVNGANVTFGGSIIGTFTGGVGVTPLVVTLNASATRISTSWLLRNITFRTVSDNPSALPRTVSVTMTDGDGGTSGTATKTVNVTAVNDQTLLSGVGLSALMYTEGDAPALITPSLVVSDADSTMLVSARIRIANNYQNDTATTQNGADFLTFVNTANITGTWDTSDGSLNLVGTDTVANYQAALRSITYHNSSDNPSTLPRLILIYVNDGTINSNVFSQTVNVVAVHDAPVLSGLESSPLAYRENQVPTPLSLSIGATDLDSDMLASAQVRLSTNYMNGQDVLSFTNTANITGSFNATTGTLTLSGSDTLANYVAALRSITYHNTSNNPNMAARTVEFQVNDGSINSNVLTRSISVTSVNDGAVLAAIEGIPLAYTENGGETDITSTVTVNEVDNTSLMGARIKIGTNYKIGQDVLSFPNTGNITGNWNVATGTLTLTGTDTVANYQAALRSVKYRNTSDNPNTLPRTVLFLVNDGTTNSIVASRIITVAAVDDAPVLSNIEGSALAYVENGGALSVSSSIAVSDLDDATLTGATVQITGNFQNGADVLSFNNTALITGSFNAATGTMTLTGTDTVGNYLLALRAVKYRNTSDHPSTLVRTVEFQANSGTANSNTLSRSITVTAINDAPTLTGIEPTELIYAAGSPAATISSTVTLADAENSLTGARVRIGTNYRNGQDTLIFSPVGSITATFDTLTGTLVLTGADSVANYQTALRSVKYLNTSATPSLLTKSVLFLVNDGFINSNVVSRLISVTAGAYTSRGVK